MLLSELEGKALEQGNMDLTTYQNAGRGSSCHKNFVACAVPAGILCYSVNVFHENSTLSVRIPQTTIFRPLGMFWKEKYLVSKC